VIGDEGKCRQVSGGHGGAKWSQERDAELGRAEVLIVELGAVQLYSGSQSGSKHEMTSHPEETVL
jgi:hypothetical protein